MMTYAHFWPFWLQRNRRDEAVFKLRFLCLTSPPGAISPSQDCYFINNSYGNEGQGRTRFSHKLDVAMNVSLCLPWPCCGIRHCLLGPEGQTQRKKWKASTFLHGTQRQQRKGEREGEKTEWTPSLFSLAVWEQHFLQVTLPLGHPSSAQTLSPRFNSHLRSIIIIYW